MALMHGREYTLQGEEVTITGDTSCFSPSQYLPSSLPSTFIQHIQELPAVLRRDYPRLTLTVKRTTLTVKRLSLQS